MERAAIFLLVVILVVVLALLAARPLRLFGRKPCGRVRVGGRESARSKKAKASPNVVVDTLNLTHHLLSAGFDPALGSIPTAASARKQAEKPLTLCAIVAAIDYSAPILRQDFSGRIIYVVKDRETPKTSAQRDLAPALYRAAARRNRVSVHLVEKEARPSTGLSAWRATGETEPTHQRLGRDDFYMGLLAWKLQCGVLTEDRMRDFQKLKTEVQPFRVEQFDHWTLCSTKTQVTPGARDYERILAPIRLSFADHGVPPLQVVSI